MKHIIASQNYQRWSLSEFGIRTKNIYFFVTVHTMNNLRKNQASKLPTGIEPWITAWNKSLLPKIIKGDLSEFGIKTKIINLFVTIPAMNSPRRNQAGKLPTEIESTAWDKITRCNLCGLWIRTKIIYFFVTIYTMNNLRKNQASKLPTGIESRITAWNNSLLPKITKGDLSEFGIRTKTLNLFVTSPAMNKRY